MTISHRECARYLQSEETNPTLQGVPVEHKASLKFLFAKVAFTQRHRECNLTHSRNFRGLPRRRNHECSARLTLFLERAPPPLIRTRTSLTFNNTIRLSPLFRSLNFLPFLSGMRLLVVLV